MTKEDAIREINKAFEPAFANYIITALAECATVSDRQEPCEDAISRKKVIDTIYHECSGENLDIDFAKVLLLQRKIKSISSVQPEPKTGHWINYKDEHKCSRCKEVVIANHLIWDDDEYEYCPNCGCRMVEPQESEE